ncbi:hypothetical protein K490DRAFT_61483 [Saccharata proteae CBS 121410]|uniref:Uncharacterized protein n=1 Tax=Saccharata proteae CBS 121410 TaxID=1314787 RepID=A0A9P4M028_9PEZI|nr:hypothetical protein K490DRAFT_61483 [Saccharata proteae CBS 121410]
MVQLTQTLLCATAILAPALQGVAAGAVDSSWTEPKLFKCIRDAGSVEVDYKTAYNCHQNNLYARDQVASSIDFGSPELEDEELNELLANTTTKHLEARNHYTLEQSTCNDANLPYAFELAKNARKNPKGYCEDLYENVKNKGVSVIDENFNNAATDVNNVLQSNAGVLMQYAFGLTPQGKALMDGGKIAKKSYMNMCKTAWKHLSNTGGCVEQISAKHKASGKTKTISGARSGAINIDWKGTAFGYVYKQFVNPKI